METEVQLTQLKEAIFKTPTKGGDSLRPVTPPASELPVNQLDAMGFKQEVEKINHNLLAQLEQLTLLQSTTQQTDLFEENLNMQQRIVELSGRFEKFLLDKQNLQEEVRRETQKAVDLERMLEHQRALTDSLKDELSRTKDKLSKTKTKLKDVQTVVKTEQKEILEELRSLAQSKKEIEEDFERTKKEVHGNTQYFCANFIRHSLCKPNDADY
jgi:hypothetical protein